VLARQTGTSIVIADAAVAGRRVGPIVGRMSAADAVKRLARAAGAQALRVGSLAWRLVDAPRNVPRAIPAASRKPEPPPAEAPESAQTAEIVVLGSKRDTRLDDYPGQVAILRGRTSFRAAWAARRRSPSGSPPCPRPTSAAGATSCSSAALRIRASPARPKRPSANI
jgi:hypothetical protein